MHRELAVSPEHTRRSLLLSAAWSVPLVVFAVEAPSSAASTGAVTLASAPAQLDVLTVFHLLFDPAPPSTPSTTSIYVSPTPANYLAAITSIVAVQGSVGLYRVTANFYLGVPNRADFNVNVGGYPQFSFSIPA